MAGAAASKAWWTHHHSVDDDEDSEHTCEDESDCEEAWDRHVLAQFASLPAVDSSWRAPEGALRRARAGRLAGDAVMVPVQFLAIPVTVLIMLVMVPVVLVVALVKKVRRAGPA